MASELDLTLEKYKSTLEKLQALERGNSPEPEQILAVLLARNTLEIALDKNEIPPETVIQISQLDRDLKQWFQSICNQLQQEDLAQIVKQLVSWRDILEPSEQAWWWFPHIKVHWWDRGDRLWNFLAVGFLAPTFSLLTDISTRFLTGGIGFSGCFSVILQSLLALMAGGTFTRTGRELVESMLKSGKIPEHLWEEVRAIASLVLLLVFIGLRSSLPWVATWYNNLGFKRYQEGRLGSAEHLYIKAIALNPDYNVAHYNLGLLYEDLQDFSQARQEYSLAVRSGFAPAHNNLARLYIMSANYPAAASLLLKGLFWLQKEQNQMIGKEIVEYSLYKNLGWTRLKQERYEEAQEVLTTAIAIDDKIAKREKDRQAAAHCLLAQVLEKLEEEKKAISAWSNCKNYRHNSNAPEEDEWVHLAKQRLNQLTIINYQ